MVQLMPLLASVSIDVDFTSILMALLFIAFYFILTPLIIKPYLKTRDMRDDATVGAREEANEFQERAEQRIEEYEEKITGARREAAEVRDSLKAQGAAEQADILEETRIELAAKISEERAQIQTQVEAANAALRDRAVVLSESIVSKVLRV